MKLFFGLLLIFFISCSENNVNDNDNLCKNTICGSGYQCDEIDGICKKINNFCFNNTQCSQNEYCDQATETCKAIIISEGCEKHQDCETWELCNFSKRECVSRDGMCNEDRDCTNHPYLKCDSNNHKCIDPKDCYYTGCENWEKCNLDGECSLIEGFCNSNIDCGDKFPYTECDLDTHSCKAPIVSCTSYTDCNSWEICNLDLGVCQSEEGNCTSFLDCIENTNGKTICDTNNHLCKTPEESSCVNIACSFFWRVCNQETGACDLPNGACDSDDDCAGEGIETCNDNHQCVRNDCTVFGCSWWKECDENTGVCSPRPSMCDSNDDCNDDFPFSECDRLVHICKKPSSMECTENRHCENWEECNFDIYKCELKEGYCLNNEQCSFEQNCNLNDHRCYNEEETCLDDLSMCDYWEECNSSTKSCELKIGYCSNDNDCNTTSTNSETVINCNYDIHKCEENNTNNECVLDETAECYTGSPSTMNVGECKTGTKTCTNELVWSLGCNGEITPIQEICNDGIDNNCNNLIDENCDVNSDSFIIYYSERDLSDGKEWKFKNLNTNTYITVVATGFSFEKYADMKQAIKYSFEYQSSPEYRMMVINKFDWTYTELSGVQIYDKMLLYLNEDQTYYLEDWYYWRSGVLAKTQNGKVYLNRKSYWTMTQYADTITHELMHLMGFSHGDNSSSGKEDSVPYFIGYATEDYAGLQ
jgi:hypothetical protein